MNAAAACFCACVRRGCERTGIRAQALDFLRGTSRAEE
jgi:hypothetical protein